MSKIGRKPIDINNVQVELKGQEIHFKGKKGASVYTLPAMLKSELVDNKLKILCNEKSSDANMVWGLHRALLANNIKGMADGFEQKIVINGLGFKASMVGNKLILALGFTNKRELIIPDTITIDIDKTGQKLSVKGTDKELVGFIASKIRAQRPPEPYKGTGIKLEDEVILRKAGKTKSA